MAVIFSTTAFMEALENEQQRCSRLRDFYPLTKHIASTLRVTNASIVAHLRGEGKEWTLTIPTKGQFALSLKEIQERLLTISHLSEYTFAEFLPKAITLFEGAGNPHLCDALLQETHSPLVEFIRRNCSEKYRGHIRAALENISYTFHLTHGGLNRRNICFDTTGGLKLTDYPITAESKGDDHLQFGSVALLLYIGASDLGAFGYLSEAAPNQEEHTRRLRCILSAGEFHGRSTLAELASALLNCATSETIERCVRRLSAEPFAPLPLLRSLLASHSHTTTINTSTIPTPPAEEYSKVDFSLCDEITNPSDQIVRYRKGKRWGYAYTDGERIAVDREIIGAYDFEEGRAVIHTPRGYGLIDTTGRIIMNDTWEQMCWYCNDNVVVAADNMGNWHLYDRMGRQLSTVACDWMGDACEGIVVAKRNGKFGYITTDGQKRTDFIYEEAYSFSDGLARVKHNGRYYHIDTSFHRHH